MITSKQIRAARVYLDWTADDLASAAGIHVRTILNIENSNHIPRPENLAAIKEAMEKAGIDFLPDNGIRPRSDLLRVFEGGDPYMQLNEDIWLTLKDRDGEVLFAFVNNELSAPEVLDIEKRMRNSGIKFRSLIQQGTKFIYPAKEYRALESDDFHNNTVVIYADKVAFMINGNEKCFIFRDQSLADTMTKMFNTLWKKHKMPVANAI